MTLPYLLNRRSVLVGAAATAGALALPRGAQAQSRDQLRFGLYTYPSNFAPWLYFGVAAECVKQQSFRGLLSYDSQGNLRPEVAESWEQEGPSSFVFRLRPNAVFHNGDPVTADEVKHSFEQIANPDNKAVLSAAFAAIEAIEVLDTHTLRIRLPEPNAAFLGLLASYDSPIVSKRSLEENPEEPVGCGPYVVTQKERGAWIELEAFDRFYREGHPRTRRLRFVAYPDDNARVAALMSGDVDIIDYVPALSMAAIREAGNTELSAVDGPAMMVMFNCKEGPFVDPRVRQAVAYAIDRDALVSGAFAGEATKSGPLPVSRSSEFYDSSIENHFERNLEKAKALLAEAGHASGLKVSFLAFTQAAHKDSAIIIQQNLKEIGIDAEVSLPDWPTRVKLGAAGQYHMTVYATVFDSNDPSALSSLLSSTLGDSVSRPFGYKNDDMDRLLDLAMKETDVEKRKKIVAEIGQVHVGDPAIISYVFRRQAYGLGENVEGFQNLPGFLTFQSGISIEEVVLR